jgi:dienelactone hydrolase
MRHLIFQTYLLLCFQQAVCLAPSNFFEYDKGIDRAVTVVQRYAIDSVTTVEKIVVNGYDSKVPFYLFHNSNIDDSKYVMLLNGLGDSKEDWVYPSEPYLEWSRNTRSIKDSLLSLGFSIIIPDIKFHGERSYELNFRSPASLPPIISRYEDDSKLFEILISSTVKDLRIIMDYIQDRENGQTQAFGVIGYSLGGNLAILLSVSDSRISSVVGCVAPINLPKNGLEVFDGSEEVIQGQWNITPMQYVESQKSSIILLMGKTDPYTSLEDLNSFYEGIPMKDKELKLFDSGHILYC